MESIIEFLRFFLLGIVNDNEKNKQIKINKKNESIYTRIVN